MSRKPKDEVAASRTITLRATPEDHARIERLVKARAAELPEPSHSALLRRLIRDADAEGIVQIHLPHEERAMLDALVEQRRAELERLGVFEARPNASTVILGLVREAAKALGGAAAQVAGGAATPAAEVPPKKAPAHDAGAVQAAVRLALQGGKSQRGIASKSGVDRGQLSRFLQTGSGLSSDSLERLYKTVSES